MSVKSISTAISDLVLAACSFYAALNVFSVSRYASSGFVSIALAASFGVLKFGVVFPNIQQKVIRMHALLTWIASVVGIPFIAAGCCVHHHKSANAKFHLVSSITAVVLTLIDKTLKEKLTIAVSGLAVLGIIFATFTSSNFYSFVGALAYGFASAVKDISFASLPGVDWFHYILAGANILLMYGLIL